MFLVGSIITFELSSEIQKAARLYNAKLIEFKNYLMFQEVTLNLLDSYSINTEEKRKQILYRLPDGKAYSFVYWKSINNIVTPSSSLTPSLLTSMEMHWFSPTILKKLEFHKIQTVSNYNIYEVFHSISKEKHGLLYIDSNTYQIGKLIKFKKNILNQAVIRQEIKYYNDDKYPLIESISIKTQYIEKHQRYTLKLLVLNKSCWYNIPIYEKLKAIGIKP